MIIEAVSESKKEREREGEKCNNDKKGEMRKERFPQCAVTVRVHKESRQAGLSLIPTASFLFYPYKSLYINKQRIPERTNRPLTAV